MIKRVLITLIVALLLNPSAWAIKRVSKDSTKAQGDSVQKALPAQPPANSDKNRPPADKRVQPPGRDSQKPVEKDRFVDEDGDGINDNLKKPPEVIKKKKEDSRKRNPEKK